MQSKQCGHHEAAPNFSRHAPQRQKQNYRVYGVQQQAREVMPSCIEAENFTIESVRHPGQRMPV